MKDVYVKVPFSMSLKGWKNKWFYIRNEEPELPEDIDHLAVEHENWSAKPVGDEMSQVKELLRILRHMRPKLDGVGVAMNFICRRIQPSKERVHPAYEYSGPGDITREAPEDIDRGDVYFRIGQLFGKNVKPDNVGQVKPFSLGNPPPLVSKITTVSIVIPRLFVY